MTTGCAAGMLGAVLLCVAAHAPVDRPSRPAFIEDQTQGILTIRDRETPVLTYRYKDQIKPGVDAKYIRSAYIHPLYSLDGKILSADFPADHLHHHGLFWAWPVVRARGVATSNWEPRTPALRTLFVRWLEREANDGVARLGVESVWKLEDYGIVAKETTRVTVHPADDCGRAIDIVITLQAVGGPLEVGGAPEDNKGYCGLCFRGAEMFKGAALTTDRGAQTNDAMNAPFQWADISTPDLGVAIFVSPAHPGAPIPWLIRNSYAGILNPSWPGLKPAVIKDGEEVHLRYRIYVHRGDVDGGNVRRAYEKYISDIAAFESSAGSRKSIKSHREVRSDVAITPALCIK